MAKSYYKIVKGVRYDRALLEAAENRIKGQGDGRISEQDLKELVDLSEDGKGITVTELRTLRYIQDEFNLTEKAQRWLADARKTTHQSPALAQSCHKPQDKAPHHKPRVIGRLRLPWR